MQRPLLVTATDLEAKLFRDSVRLEPLPFPLGSLYRVGNIHLAHLGIGKVNTAAGLALAIRDLSPDAVIQFGIGGAFVGSFLSVGSVALADAEVHLDSGVRTEAGWGGMEVLGFPLLKREASYYNHFPTDAALTESLEGHIVATRCLFGTSETVTGSFDEASVLQARFDVSVESMEGAAAAQVCLALDVPFAELRGISNIVGERQKRAWDIPGAVRAVNRAMMIFLRAQGLL